MITIHYFNPQEGKVLQAKLNGLPISIPVDIRINRNHPEMDKNLKKQIKNHGSHVLSFSNDKIVLES